MWNSSAHCFSTVMLILLYNVKPSQALRHSFSSSKLLAFPPEPPPKIKGSHIADEVLKNHLGILALPTPYLSSSEQGGFGALLQEELHFSMESK
uniref:Putative secreted protein n=1 Tax=Ixodes ricinus TaxID=34613 RepID=A0A6B0U313_IXORI